MAFLELTRRAPNERKSRMFNAMLVTLVEHGLTPSSLVAPLDLSGRARVDAGGGGRGPLRARHRLRRQHRGPAKMLYEAMPKSDPKADLPALATDVVARFNANKTIVPGIGHPFHKPIDPRTPRLIALAKEDGLPRPLCRAHPGDRCRSRTQQGQAFADQRDRHAGCPVLRDGLRLEDLPRSRRHGARGRARRPYPRGIAQTHGPVGLAADRSRSDDHFLQRGAIVPRSFPLPSCRRAFWPRSGKSALVARQSATEGESPSRTVGTLQIMILIGESGRVGFPPPSPYASAPPPRYDGRGKAP